jgi:hypothetical protein
MKRTLIILSLLIVNIIQAQIVRIKVFEKLEFVTFDSLGIFSAVSQLPPHSFVEISDCEYVLDLNLKKGKFYIAGNLDVEFDLSIENFGSKILFYFFVEGYNLTDIGIVVNLDVRHESFDWFSKDIDDFYNIVKGIKFEIVKAQ